MLQSLRSSRMGSLEGLSGQSLSPSGFGSHQWGITPKKQGSLKCWLRVNFRPRRVRGYWFVSENLVWGRYVCCWDTLSIAPKPSSFHKTLNAWMKLNTAWFDTTFGESNHWQRLHTDLTCHLHLCINVHSQICRGIQISETLCPPERSLGKELTQQKGEGFYTVHMVLRLLDHSIHNLS